MKPSFSFELLGMCSDELDNEELLLSSFNEFRSLVDIIVAGFESLYHTFLINLRKSFLWATLKAHADLLMVHINAEQKQHKKGFH